MQADHMEWLGGMKVSAVNIRVYQDTWKGIGGFETLTSTEHLMFNQQITIPLSCGQIQNRMNTDGSVLPNMRRPARTAGLLRVPHVLILPQGQNERQCCREFPRWYELRSKATKLRHATTERIHTWKNTSYSALHQTFVIPKLPQTKGKMWQ